MGADAQLGYAKADATTAVVAKVVLKIVVQIVGLVHIAVDNQLQVVTDAATRGVDTAVVVEFGYKVRRGVYLAAVLKVFRVQVAVNRWTNGICQCRATPY